jgi:hypothetical protein
MNDVKLFESTQSDLLISNKMMRFSGMRLRFSDIVKAECLKIKPNYLVSYALGLIGLVLIILGKFRSGITVGELFQVEIYVQLFNRWDATGSIVFVFAVLNLLFLKDIFVIRLSLKDGRKVHYTLKQKADQYAAAKIDKALKQAIRYNEFIQDSEIMPIEDRKKNE